MIGQRVAKDPATGRAALPRGALQVFNWIKSYGFGVALGANNVGDAFIQSLIDAYSIGMHRHSSEEFYWGFEGWG